MPAAPHAMAPHAMAMAPRPMMRVAQPASPHAPVSRMTVKVGRKRARPAMQVAEQPNTPFPQFMPNGIANGGNCFPVPGLGFDVPHAAAIAGPGAAGGGFCQQSPSFFPFFGGGYYEPSASEVAEQAPPAEDAESEAPEVPGRARNYQVVQEPAPEPAVETASAAPRDAEEFVFVRRDGTVFFAVAYVWDKGTLRYITNEGLRRSVAKDVLDLDATQQFNEQRGLNFRLPA